VLEDARANASEHVFAGMFLQDDCLNAAEVEKLGQEQPGRASPMMPTWVFIADVMPKVNPATNPFLVF
jgi:hypothetical protein